jgi:hypothetical protein
MPGRTDLAGFPPEAGTTPHFLAYREVIPQLAPLYQSHHHQEVGLLPEIYSCGLNMYISYVPEFVTHRIVVTNSPPTYKVATENQTPTRSAYLTLGLGI